MALEDDLRKGIGERQGAAIKFTDIDGIGPATRDKITSIRGVDAPRDVADMSADELADKANISRDRASKAISGGGGNPAVSKRDNTGSVSAAGIKTRQGDFWVEFTEMDKARARNDAMSRSERAVREDDRQRAPITTNYETWKDSPGRWDFPGVDTPTQEPKTKPKDFMHGQQPNTADVDEESEVATGSQSRKQDAPSGKENFFLEGESGPLPASDFTQGPQGENMRDRRIAQNFLAAAGVPASSEEVFKGTNTGSITNSFMGPTYNVDQGPVETDRVEEEQEPPESALKRQSGDLTKDFGEERKRSEAIVTVFESEAPDDVSLPRFKRAVDRKQRQMGGLADNFAAAQLVAEDFRD